MGCGQIEERVFSSTMGNEGFIEDGARDRARHRCGCGYRCRLDLDVDIDNVLVQEPQCPVTVT